MGSKDKENMKLLFENWKKFLKEGEVIRGPWAGTPEPGAAVSEELIEFTNNLEDVLGKKLEDVHGQSPMDIPIEKIEQLEVVMKEIERMFDMAED